MWNINPLQFPHPAHTIIVYVYVIIMNVEHGYMNHYRNKIMKTSFTLAFNYSSNLLALNNKQLATVYNQHIIKSALLFNLNDYYIGGW